MLPFQNMSGDPEQEYFADGMVEEIITALSRIRWLFVIARNSSFTYKGQAVDVKQVGRELGVRYVLEGSVRKAGNRVRITGQLIDAATGAHLWADRFDGSLEDVFELQDQVAVSVAGVIEPTLQAAEIRRSAARPTNDLTAYDLYLRALSHLQSWQKEEISSRSTWSRRRSSAIRTTAPLSRWQRAVNLFSKPTIGPTILNQPAAKGSISPGERLGPSPTTRLFWAMPPSYWPTLARTSMPPWNWSTVLWRSIRASPRGWRDSGFLRLYAGQPDAAINHFETYLRLNPRADRAAP